MGHGAHDPEHERIEALLERVATGAAGDAEREELGIYLEQRPDLADQLARRVREQTLGAGWLERVRRDGALSRTERSRRARIERGAGVALLLAGALLTPVPSVGFSLLGLGSLVLLVSFIRTRLASHARDPYKDVIR